MIFPGAFPDKKSTASEWIESYKDRLHSGLIDGSLSFDDFYLNLDDKAIDSIEVMLGPKASDGDKTVVESLLTRFCNNSIMKDSNLKIR